MLKKLFKTIIHKLGFEVIKKRKLDCLLAQLRNSQQGSYYLYKYEDSRGNFDYNLYRQIQIDGNKTKIDEVWVQEKNIEYLSDYIRNNIKIPKFGICHGTRRGNEQAWFRKYLNCEVIGTEISDTVGSFSHTIEWDFHEIKEAWIDSADFIYSNSFDHSYDPQKCLSAWMKCIKRGGICIIEHSSLHAAEGASLLDPFGVSLQELLYLITKWGNGSYCVKQILDNPPVKNLKGKETGIRFIVIHKF